MLKELSELVNELGTTNSSNEKKDILKKYPQCKEILFYVYNPLYQFHVTSKNLIKNSDIVEDYVNISILSVLDVLRKRTVTGHEAIGVANGFINRNEEYRELIHCIIDKNLKVRIDASIINKVFKGLVPEFKVALAKKYEDYASKVDFDNDTWYGSRKLDGVRCITIVSAVDVVCYSRNGKEFTSLNTVKDAVINHCGMFNGLVLDGEICLLDDDGAESFQGVMKEIRKKNHTIENPRYKIFDVLTREEFDSQTSNRTFSDRLDMFSKITELGSDVLVPEAQEVIRDQEHLLELTDKAKENGWEGIMLRKDVEYKGKRSNDLLKVKEMQDAEYVVTGVDYGPIRYIVDGQDTEEIMLSNMSIMHRDNEVGVGSGFTIGQRKFFREHPEELIGKTVTIQYFEETEDKDGKFSLRFPVLKCIHGDKRVV